MEEYDVYGIWVDGLGVSNEEYIGKVALESTSRVDMPEEIEIDGHIYKLQWNENNTVFHF